MRGGALGGYYQYPAHADDGHADVATPMEGPRPMNTARTLASETSYLRLARGMHDADVTEAVRELDERIEPHAPAVENVERFLAAQMGVTERSPHRTPVTVGKLDKFACPYMPDRVSYRLVELGGHELVVLMSKAADCEATEAAVNALVATFKAKLTRLLTDT